MSKYRVKQIVNVLYNGQIKYEYHFEKKKLFGWENIGFYEVDKYGYNFNSIGRVTKLESKTNIEEDVKEYLLRHEQSRSFIQGVTIIPVFTKPVEGTPQLKYMCIKQENVESHDVFEDSGEFYFYYHTNAKLLDYEDAVTEIKRVAGFQVMRTQTNYFLVGEDKKSIIVM